MKGSNIKTRWSDEELVILYELRSSCETSEILEIFHLLGYTRTPSSVCHKAKELGLEFDGVSEPDIKNLGDHVKAIVEKVIQKRDLEEESTTLDRSFNPKVACHYPTSSEDAQRNSKTAKREARFIVEDLEEIRRQVNVTSSRLPVRKQGSKESLVVILSDQHIGRLVHNEDRQEIYNMEIGLERLVSTPERVLNAITPSQKENIDEVVLCLIGDHVDGEGIFPSQEHFLEEHAAEQVKQTTKAFWHVIQEFKQMFGMCRIITTKGNHGRCGTSQEANWDNILFQQLELLVDLENDPELTIKNRYGDFNTCEVKGWKGLLRHKACVQADTGGAIAKFAGWNGIHNWDFFGFGHYHHWGIMTWNGKPIFRNGSTIGGDDYAETLAYYDHPTQLCFGISEKRIPTFIYPIQYL